MLFDKGIYIIISIAADFLSTIFDIWYLKICILDDLHGFVPPR